MKQYYILLVAALIAFSASAQRTITKRVSSSTDDAEEAVGNGDMYDNSSDLELVYDDFVNDDQLVGMRFTNISIPANAEIIHAYIQFQVDEDKQDDPCSLDIYAEKAVNPATYATTSFNISSRDYFDASVNWNPAPWGSSTIGDQLYGQRTSDITTLIDSIIAGPWVNGNAMAFKIEGTGVRTAESFDGDPSGAPMLVIQYTLPGDYVLQVFHASDLEGGVEAIEDAPAFAAIIDALEDEFENSVTISSGDNYIPGPFFNAASEDPIEDSLRAILSDFYGTPLTSLGTERGRIDVSIMNVIGFNASCFGNHEFDQGVGTIQDIILSAGGGANLAWMGAQFPYLSANLDFSNSGLASRYVGSVEPWTDFVTDVTNPAAANDVPKVAPATVIEVNGEEIGVVGATTQLLATISSPGDVSVVGNPTMNDMTQLATVIQPYIDSLTNEGVDKIIVATHLQQFSLEQQLAGLLDDVDIILAGGSDFLLADNDDVLRAGDVADGDYPYATVNAGNDSVLIVSTDGEYSYVGRLVVAFDANGNILPSTVYGPTSGAFATIPKVVNGIYGQEDPYANGSKGYFVERLTNSIIDIVVAKDGNTFGKTQYFLDGRRGTVRTEQSNMGDLTADANLWVAKQFDDEVMVSLKNGGGIRAEIGVIDLMSGDLLPPQPNPVAGKDSLEVSQLDIENTLRFNNTLVVVETNPGGLRRLLEHGISDWDGVATQGKMPQVGGVRFSFDPTQAAGSRIVNMALIDEDDMVLDSVVVDGALHGDTMRTIKLVSLNFLVENDGDGYPYSIETSNPIDLDASNLPANGAASFADEGSEQDALAEYLLAFHTNTPYMNEEVGPEMDDRIQILSLRDDSVFVEATPMDTTDTTTLVPEYRFHDDVAVYPVPSSGTVFVNSTEVEVDQISIFNTMGQMIRKTTINARFVALDLHDLETGNYFILVESAEGVSMHKLQLIK